MSISILNRGASGGLKPELTVISPSGSTIDLLQNSIIVDTYTLSADETEHTFVVKVGTYTVRGTPEVNNKTVEVVIDTVGVYEVDITRFTLYTDFASKASDWTETGGSFNYGNGVYINAGSSKGTATLANGDYTRILEIPVKLREKFFVEYADTITTTANNQMGFNKVYFVDDSGNEVYRIDRGDAWSDSANQYLEASGGSIFSSTAGYSGVLITHRVEYENGIFAYYMNGSKKNTYSVAIDSIEAVRFYFVGAKSSSYPQGGVKVTYLDVAEQ